MRESKVKARIEDEQVKEAYQKYETYLSELSILDEVASRGKSQKVNMFQLYGMYKKNGFDPKTKKEMLDKFKNFSSSISEAKKEHPGADLRDITTKEGRTMISGIISKTQGAKDFKPADLLDVALAENVALYAALKNYNEKVETKEAVLVHYDLDEQQFDKMQEKYQNFKKSGMMEPFTEMCEKVDGQKPSTTIAYAAAVVEDRPVNTMEALRRIGVIEQDKELAKYSKEIELDGVSELVKDLIRRDPNEKDPEGKISELENAAYAKRMEHAKRLAREADGRANITIVGENIKPMKVVVDPEIKGRAAGGEER